MSTQISIRMIEASQTLSPRKKIQLQNAKSIQDIMSKGGEEVYVFELNEIITKYAPLNDLTLKILDNLQPASLDFTPAQNLEDAYLKFAKMKITSKLSKLHYDESLFFTYISESKNEIVLDNLLVQLADKFGIYFSIQEQLAIRNALLPE